MAKSSKNKSLLCYVVVVCMVASQQEGLGLNPQVGQAPFCREFTCYI